MSDESGRKRRGEEGGDFGPPLFPDEPTNEVHGIDLSFGENDTGPLPHWTDPPTGEVPRVLSTNTDSDDVDVWSSFSTSQPVWKEEAAGRDPSGALDEFAASRRPGDPTNPEPYM